MMMTNIAITTVPITIANTKNHPMISLQKDSRKSIIISNAAVTMSGLSGFLSAFVTSFF
jgi:hypothetical protein